MDLRNRFSGLRMDARKQSNLCVSMFTRAKSLGTRSSWKLHRSFGGGQDCSVLPCGTRLFGGVVASPYDIATPAIDYEKDQSPRHFLTCWLVSLAGHAVTAYSFEVFLI